MKVPKSFLSQVGWLLVLGICVALLTFAVGFAARGAAKTFMDGWNFFEKVLL